MNFILNDYLDSADSAAQYDTLLSMSQEFEFNQEFANSNYKETINDLPF